MSIAWRQTFVVIASDAMKTVSIRMTDQQATFLERQAKKKTKDLSRVTVSTIVRGLVAEAMRKEGTK